MERNRIFSTNGLELAGKTLLQAVKDFFTDSSPQWAAAIAYYSLLSAFPLLLAAAAIAAFFVNPNWAIQQGTRLLGNFLPDGADKIRQAVQGTIQARGRVGIISLAFLLFSGSRVFGVITKALNIAYDVDNPYGFLKRTLIELLMTVTIGMLFVLTLVSLFVLDFASSILSFLPADQTLFGILRYAIPGLLLLAAFYLAYRYVPRRNVTNWAAFSGALLAALLVLAARPLFIFYVRTFANYNLIYGPLALVIVLILWAWISSVILLFGGEVTSHVQDLFVEGRSEQEVGASHAQRNPSKACA